VIAMPPTGELDEWYKTLWAGSMGEMIG